MTTQSSRSSGRMRVCGSTVSGESPAGSLIGGAGVMTNPITDETPDYPHRGHVLDATLGYDDHMASLEDMRREFPALGDRLCFLDWAATGLIPERTRLSVHRYVDELARCEGADATAVHGTHGETRQRARTVIAGLLGARRDDVALVENTTQGIQIAAESLRLEPGDNVLVSELDYLAVALPWLMRRRADRIEVRQVPCREGRLLADDVLACVDDRTRIISVSTTGWTTGALADIDGITALARSRGIHVVLDAVQTFGTVPLDVGQTDASFIAVGGHKWMNATLGAGFLYVRPGTAARARPQRFGFLNGHPSSSGSWPEWFSSGHASLDEDVVFPSNGRIFESGGTPSYVGALGVLGMGELLAEVGIDAIAKQVRDLGGVLIEQLESRGLKVWTPKDPAQRAGLIVATTGTVERDKAIVAGLRERGVAISARWAKGIGGTRWSIHGMNNAADLDRAMSVLDDIG